MVAFIGLFRRDLRLALRHGSDTGIVLGFFVLAIVLFPLGVGPEPAILQRIGAGVVWVAALLAAQICALSDPALRERLRAWRKARADEVVRADEDQQDGRGQRK